MIELLVLGVVGVVVAMVVFGVIGAVMSLVVGVILLPFKILGLMFKGLGFLLALPFLALGGFALLLVAGLGLFALLFPLLPLAAAVALLVWLFRRKRVVTTA